MERLQTSEFLQRADGQVILDVRSPGEYHHAHISGAINLPLFTDEERKVVGTTYKQKSREQAIKAGLDYFGPKMRRMVEEVEAIVAERAKAGDAQSTATAPTLFVYCWRGGMRSGAVAWLLNLYGFKVCTLTGGYKAFRNYVLRSFEKNYTLHVLGGYTGSGKTEVLQQLRTAGDDVIDLEGLANHKGSAFGNIGMPPQPTQEMFENLLAGELRRITSFHPQAQIWLEDESQRIGNLNIPAAFWQQMRSAPIYFLDIPFEERLNHIVDEYSALDRERLASAIERISKRLGGLETKLALEHLHNDDVRDCFSILLKYYDKRYLKGLNSRPNLSELLHSINCSVVTPANASLLRPQPVT